MKNKMLLLIIALLPITSLVQANTNIAELFPYAAQSHDEKGKIEMENDSTYIEGSNNGRVDFKYKDGKLEGKCDNVNVTCTLSNDIGPSINLQWVDQTPALPSFKEYPSDISGNNLNCNWDSGGKTFNNNVYQNIKVTHGCNIKANSNDIYIKGEVEVTSNSVLYLSPGNYWMNSLELDYGSIKVLGNGVVNIYVENEVELVGPNLGDKDNPINIYQYNKKDFKLGENLTWYGDLITSKELKYKGSTNLHGTIRAKSLDLEGNAKLYLTPGEYWYEDIELQNSGEIFLTGSYLTHLHIKDELELEGYAKVNISGNPLLIFVYGDKKGEEGDVDLEGSSEIHGHLYVQGEVEMQGNTRIYGAVNVVDLEMKGSSAIEYRKFVGGNLPLNHYRLHFNTSSNELSAYACGDVTCSSDNYFKGTVEKLQIKDGINKNNIYNFTNKKNKEMPIVASNPNLNGYYKNSCMTFVVHQENPSSSNALQCYIDGDYREDCTVCKRAEPVNSYGYVYGSATIPRISSSGASEFTVKQGGGNGLATAGSTSVAINNGSELMLPLDVTFDKAEKVDLVLADTDGREYPVSVTFVPETLAWETDLKTDSCGTTPEGFNYSRHHQGCEVLGKAGEKLTLQLKAYGKDKELITNYEVSQNNLVTVSEYNAKQIKYNETSDTSVKKLTFQSGETTINHEAIHVGLIEAIVKGHCAPYAIKEDKKCGLLTKGDSQILGRTVPNSFSVTRVRGNIDGNVVYAAQTKVIDFSLTPGFIVQGLDLSKNVLSSYSGEFSGGLVANSNITLGDKLISLGAKLSNSNSKFSFTKSEDSAGEHLLTVVTNDLTFDKVTPFSEAKLNLPLLLTINEHDTIEVASGETLLANIEDTLRFGFLTIDNTEQPVNVDGKMQTRLNYFDSKMHVKEDKNSSYSILNKKIISKSVSDGSKLPNGSVISADSKIIKATVPNVWRGEISISDAPNWLKPYDEAKKDLVAPNGQLTVTDRKRGNNRFFNRREAVR